jgi:hypothetical protein
VDEERLVGYEVDRVSGGGRCTQAAYVKQDGVDDG